MPFNDMGHPVLRKDDGAHRVTWEQRGWNVMADRNFIMFCRDT